MLDALWIVAIILEQPAYALIVPSRPIRFGLLILLLQVSRFWTILNSIYAREAEAMWTHAGPESPQV